MAGGVWCDEYREYLDGPAEVCAMSRVCCSWLELVIKSVLAEERTGCPVPPQSVGSVIYRKSVYVSYEGQRARRRIDMSFSIEAAVSYVKDVGLEFQGERAGGKFPLLFSSTPVCLVVFCASQDMQFFDACLVASCVVVRMV